MCSQNIYTSIILLFIYIVYYSEKKSEKFIKFKPTLFPK